MLHQIPVENRFRRPGTIADVRENYHHMARTYLIFGDIEGKLNVLRVECTRCRCKGRYGVRRLIAQYGRKASMMKWKEYLNGDYPKRDASQLHLPKVVSAQTEHQPLVVVLTA